MKSRRKNWMPHKQSSLSYIMLSFRFFLFLAKLHT